MNTMNEYKPIEISNILNFVENPRHDVGVNEADTIKKLINKVGSQYMYNLAKDIYENGLMQSNLPILVFDTKKKKYIVYEGNRRIACLKFLTTPEILSPIDKSLQQRIENLIKSNKGTIPYEVFCFITSEDQAFLMMERIHSGEDKGRGVKAWTPKEKDIFQERINKKKSIALVIVELTEKFLHKDLTTIIDFSTIKRFFNTRNMKKALDIGKGENEDFTKEKIELINYLIDKSIEEGAQKGVALTRLFNKVPEIEAFFIPLIEEYKRKLEGQDTKATESEKDKKSEKGDNTENDDNTPPEDENEDERPGEGPENTERVLKISINKSEYIYFTNQTIDLRDKLVIENGELFNSDLFEVTCPDLVISNSIVQPNSLPGEYTVTFKYYMDNSKKLIHWQDSLKIVLKITKSSSTVTQPLNVLSKVFVDKYMDQLVFDHSEKVKALMYFLATENKNGKYSYFINIVSRMFLEFSFRMYASKVLKYDNKTIEDKSQSLQGLIDHCCNKIEVANPQVFVRHIKKARTSATNKVELLQKSVHYYDVTISNDEIQVMFANLLLYLEVVFSELVIEQLQKSG